MKKCPFCLAEIPDAAVKCQHCGEWLDGSDRHSDSQPGDFADSYAKFQIAFGLVMVGIVLLVLFALAMHSAR